MSVADFRSSRPLNDALSQRDRQAQAPKPEAVAVDGRSLNELLAFGARYGALIRFYDLSDMPNGDWSIFFSSDPAVRAAVHAALDIPEIEAGLRLLIAEARAAEADARHAHVRRVHRVILRLLVIFDGEEVFVEEDIVLRLTLVAGRDRRDRLSGPLGELRAHRHRRSENRDWHQRDLDLVEEVAMTLLAELEAAAGPARAEVDAALQRRGHPPQAALWNAFVQLYTQARGKLNHFPRRLLDFYYGDVLRQKSREAVPAQTYLTFKASAGIISASVPKGTRFLAGTDTNGNPIYYAGNTSLAVVPATVVALRVRRVADDSVLSGIVSPTPSGNASFPLFGGESAGSNGALDMQPASIGFIVSSPLLMLTGGKRRITITFASAPARSRVSPTPPPPGLLTTEAIAALPPAVTLPAPDAERREMPTGLWFSLSYSTAAGWVTVERVHFEATDRDAEGIERLVFAFELPVTAPPLVATSTKPAPGAATPDLLASAFPDLADEPTVIVQLLDHPLGAPGSPTEGAPVSRGAYRILSEIKIATVAIDVTVDGLVPPQLASSSGAINPTQNFALFGLAPPQGATFTLSAPELFAKVPSRLALTIDWAGRPISSTGFAGWYKDYVIDADGNTVSGGLFDNSSFRVGFGLAGPGLWSLAEDQPLYLFRTDLLGTGADPPAAAAAVNARSVLAVPEIKAATTEPTYFDPAASALRMTLIAPAEGFGDTLYARNLMAASAANAAAAQAGGKSIVESRLSAVRDANGDTTAGDYASRVGTAIQAALAAFNAAALAALREAIPASAADADRQGTWHQALADAVSRIDADIGAAPRWRRARAAAPPATDGDLTRNLQAWADAHRAGLTTAGANGPLQRGDALLAAASGLADTWANAADGSPAVTRPQVDGALRTAAAMLPLQTAVPVLPNPPWLPMASAVGIDYAASDVRSWSGNPGSLFQVEGAARVAAAVQPVATRAARTAHRPFRHLRPFHVVATPHVARLDDDDEVISETWLLPPLAGKAALHIDLSAPVDAITLLFVLEAGPDGWSTAENELRWEKAAGEAWVPITLLDDTTNGLRNSGVVSLQVATSQHDFQDVAQYLRVVLIRGSTNAAYVSSVTTNALTAAWMPPAGAATLGVALPAGTISQSETALSGVAGIAQPMQGFGGVPPATGRDFDLWMAEQLRHKGRAIASDDYARLALAAIPSLWQLASVPAIDELTGRPVPGKLWLIAVAGPQTPNIADPSVPAVDPATLTEIGEMVASLASPFVRVTVTNPPWVRITVKATLVFSADDTPGGWIARLQKELVGWLSPWPDDALSPRGTDYWTRQAIAEFVRRRPYVKGIVSLHLRYDRDPAHMRWHYFTSAVAHELEAFTPPVSDSGTRVRTA